MDIFSIEAVVGELRERLVGARINKIHQPGPDDLIFRLWNGREELRLLLSAAPRLSRIHLTSRSYPNPFTPPRFCQLLRARLARLVGIAQVPGERIVYLDFLGAGAEEYRLVHELLGRQANMLLLDGQGRIVDSLHRVEGEGGRRSLLAGEIYQAPPAKEGLHLADGVPQFPAEQPFAAWLKTNIIPMAPLVARDLAAAVAGGESPAAVLGEFRSRWLEKRFDPTLAALDGENILTAFALPRLGLSEAEHYATLSEAADEFYYGQAFEVGRVGGRAELESVIRKRLKKLRSRLENIESEQEDLEDFDRQRQLGELLLANLHQLRKGMEKVVLDDYYQDPPVAVTIELDPRLSPQENAQRYFKGFKKGKRGVGHVARRIEETREELAWLEEAALALDEAQTPAEMEAVRRDLEEADLISTPAGPASRRRPADPRDLLRKSATPGGFTLFWGKNSRTNDYVSRTLTGPDDLWFHAWQIPGCHLVLKRGEHRGDIPEADLLFAAALAAGYSRGKDDGKVEVMVAEGKAVHRPKGARPGLVTVDRYRTLNVAPKRLEEE